MNWKSIITSSTDPNTISLFVKSLATFAILFGIDNTVVNEASGQLTNLLLGTGMVFTALTGLYGLIRKVKFGQWSAR